MKSMLTWSQQFWDWQWMPTHLLAATFNVVKGRGQKPWQYFTYDRNMWGPTRIHAEISSRGLPIVRNRPAILSHGWMFSQSVIADRGYLDMDRITEINQRPSPVLHSSAWRNLLCDFAKPVMAWATASSASHHYNIPLSDCGCVVSHKLPQRWPHGGTNCKELRAQTGWGLWYHRCLYHGQHVVQASHFPMCNLGDECITKIESRKDTRTTVPVTDWAFQSHKVFKVYWSVQISTCVWFARKVAAILLRAWYSPRAFIVMYLISSASTLFSQFE